jgi:UDP-glucose 4-epimerase
MGKLDHVSVFGGEYPTPDGTAIRDYIHIADLCEAHVLALEYLRNGGASDYFNLGNGQGYSVNEVIEAARKVTDSDIRTRIEAARPGDPSRLTPIPAKLTQFLAGVQSLNP